MIRPRVGKANDGQIISLELINGMIARTEYAGDLLRQYKLIAGNGMYVEPHYDGTRISYNQPVKGGASPALPLLTESEQNVEKLLNGQVPIDQLSGYTIDLAYIQKAYGEDARLWGRFKATEFPQFFGAYRQPEIGGDFVWFLLQPLGPAPFYPDPVENYFRPLPEGDPFGRSILKFDLVDYPGSKDISFAIGTESLNPFL